MRPILIVAVLLALTGVILFSEGILSATGVGFSGKTIWDWMDLLIVPAVLAVGGIVGGWWLNKSQKDREQAIEKQGAQNTALQAYIDKMADLLTEYRDLCSELSLKAEDAEEAREAAKEAVKEATNSDYWKAENAYWEAEMDYQEARRQYQEAVIDFQRELPRLREYQKNPEEPSKTAGHWVNPHYAEKLEQDKRTKVQEKEREMILKDQRRRELEAKRELDEKEDVDDEVNANKTRLASSESIQRETLRLRRKLGVKRMLIRAQTLTVLDQVGERHKRAIMRFLWESGLTTDDKEVGKEQKGEEVEDLVAINLREAEFNRANLKGMDLTKSNLKEVRLQDVNLRGGLLPHVNLSAADLSSADLSYSNLSSANLSYSNLSSARLTGADLSAANLSSATVTYEQLRSCKSLEAATLPDGTKNGYKRRRLT